MARPTGSIVPTIFISHLVCRRCRGHDGDTGAGYRRMPRRAKRAIRQGQSLVLPHRSGDTAQVLVSTWQERRAPPRVAAADAAACRSPSRLPPASRR